MLVLLLTVSDETLVSAESDEGVGELEALAAHFAREGRGELSPDRMPVGFEALRSL